LGRAMIDLSGDPYSETRYDELLRTLHGAREAAPPIGKRPDFEDNKLSPATSPAARRPPTTDRPGSVQPITLLHLSDLQFGRYHRFGRLGAFDPDAAFDTLIGRLTHDLDLLKRDHRLVPQIVVISGDLAEWGLPAEFNEAREFLLKLIEHLGLGRNRVVIVPG